MSAANALKRKNDYIATRPNILYELVVKRRGAIPVNVWDWMALSINPNISRDMMDQSKDLPWPLLHNNTDIDFIQCVVADYMPWQRRLLSYLHNVVFDNHEEDWNNKSDNPHITLDFVLKNIDKINFHILSNNNFLWDDDAYEHALAADIAERQKKIRMILDHDMAYAICKYIDYQ